MPAKSARAAAVAASAAIPPRQEQLPADPLVVAVSRMLGLQSMAAGAALAGLATLQLAAANPAIAIAVWSALRAEAARGLMDAGCDGFAGFVGSQMELAQRFSDLAAGRPLVLAQRGAAPAEIIVERRRQAVLIKFPDRRRA